MSRQPVKYARDSPLNPCQEVCGTALRRFISACKDAFQNAPQNSEERASSALTALLELQQRALSASYDRGATIWPLREIFERHNNLKISIGIMKVSVQPVQSGSTL